LDSICVGQNLMIFGWIQTNRQYHHFKFFFFYTLVGGCVPYNDIFTFRDFSDDGCIASDKPDPGKLFRSLVVAFKILSMGTNVVMKYGTGCLCLVIFCQYHLFLGIGAADARTVTVLVRGHPSGTDTLNPGYFLGMTLVGGTQHLAFVWPGGG